MNSLTPRRRKTEATPTEVVTMETQVNTMVLVVGKVMVTSMNFRHPKRLLPIARTAILWQEISGKGGQ